MIKLMRLDDRMIHGQIVIRWTKVLDIKMLILANDAVAADKTQVMVLKMAAPPGCRVSVLSIADTIKNVTDPRAADMSIMVITTNVVDTYTIAKAAPDQVQRINFGNLFLDGNVQHLHEVTAYVYVDDKELAMIKELYDDGFRMDGQLTPDDVVTPLNKVQKNV